jgi:hypothetical protein
LRLILNNWDCFSLFLLSLHNTPNGTTLATKNGVPLEDKFVNYGVHGIEGEK